MAEDAQTPQPTSAAHPEQRIAELKAMTFGFDADPLEHFRGLSAEEIEAHQGIGPKFRQRIQAALAELDTLLPPADHGAPAASGAPAPAASHGSQEHHEELEPAAPGGGSLALLVTFLVLAAVVLCVFFFVGNPHLTEEQQQRLAAAEQTAQAQLAALNGIKADSLAAAEGQAQEVYEAAHDSNFGDARARLSDVDTTVRTLKRAAQRGPAGDEPALPRASLNLAPVEDALAQARAALQLDEPQTQQSVEAACQRLYDAVRALRPRGEEVNGKAGGEADGGAAPGAAEVPGR